MVQGETHDFHILPRRGGSPGPTLAVGVMVCVRNHFLGTWSTGFRVTEVLDDGYRIERLSDALRFPDVFPFEDVRQERRQRQRGFPENTLDQALDTFDDWRVRLDRDDD